MSRPMTNICERCRERRTYTGSRVCAACCEERRGAIYFRTVPKYRCPGCRRETTVRPCVLCAARAERRYQDQEVTCDE